ncbi:AraC family transcriptional regulator [Nocardia terpenica]|uniref:HTH araC/xylS-type domain-containing protein n=1 Tax=Nocardia terpenica TaxID=455432 RepID=A0A164MGG1_9NOCA|nr:AraC family transcriptional regulator [Nocardia terpenica]KZM73335.1 hypothetical protein AWN90_32270 [Nocardia terpenica]NQE87513.1 AraC family transcriptional regulator [Nocardia terpenica]
MGRFDPQFSAANIAPTALVSLCAFATERGVDPEPWFLGTGMAAEKLDAPGTWVSYRQATSIIRCAVRSMSERSIGLAVGARNAIVGFGILGFAMRSCRTVGEAAVLGKEMRRLAGCLTDFDLIRDRELTAVRVLQPMPDPELVRFLTEHTMSAALSFGRSLVDDEFGPIVARLSYAEPAYSAEYRRYFRCPVEFDCAVSELVFPVELFRRPIPTHSRASLGAALDTCRRMIGAADPRYDIVASVESILDEPSRTSMSMAEVADRLFVTERTLRRHLHTAGERFSDIRDRVRQRRALRLVRGTRMTIAQIAVETGYSDAREFRRAYVRWNGEPPSRTRRSAELLDIGCDTKFGTAVGPFRIGGIIGEGAATYS